MGNGWPTIKFGDVVRPNLRPYTLAADEDADLVGMRLYGLGPFHRERKSAMRIAKKSHFVIKAGDVIYNKLFAWKGTFGIVPPELDGMFVSDKFPTYALDRSRVDESYLAWFFRHPAVWEEAQSMSTGSAALSKLTLNPPKFLLLTMHLPPLSEQRRIVGRIEELAAEIAAAQRLRAEVAGEAASLMATSIDHLSSGLNANGVLGDVLLQPPRNGWSVRCDNAEDGTAILSLGAVTGFMYRKSEFKRTSVVAPRNGHFWLQTGDLLMTRSNTPELVGHAAIYDGTPTPCIYPDLMMRLAVDERRVSKRFVWVWLRSMRARDYIMARAKGTSPSMKKISQGVVMSIPFPLDLPQVTQVQLIAEVDLLQAEVDKLKAVHAETTRELDSFMPAVLDRAFKGELV